MDWQRDRMPTSDDVRRLALALPEAYEDTHRRKPAFRVNKRIFAMLGVEHPSTAPGFFAPLSGARPVASLTVDREDQLNSPPPTRRRSRPRVRTASATSGWTRSTLTFWRC